MTPGFQMSFAATSALILLFPAWSRRAQALPWVLRGVALLVISSLIAALATSPLAAAYFNRSAQYGMVANLLVVPVMGALVMPAGVIAALLTPVGLAAPALWLMGLGTRWMLHVAELVTGWGGAVVTVAAPHWAAVPLGGTGVTVALLALHGARGQLSRIVAALAGMMVLAGALVWMTTERPHLLIAGDGSAVGLMTAAGRVLSKPAGAFVADSWLRADGDLATAEDAAARSGWQGEKGARQASLGGLRIVHLSGKGAGDRLAEGRGFLLHAARVRQDQGRGLHRRHEGGVVQRLAQDDAVHGAEALADDAADIRVVMDRQHHLHVRVVRHQPRQRVADAQQGFAEVLAPVQRHKDQPLRRVEVQPRAGVGRRDMVKRVDHRVAGDMDVGGGIAFGQQLVGGKARGCEMPAGQVAGHDAVHLLGEGVRDVAGAQARLDMAEWDAVVE